MKLTASGHALRDGQLVTLRSPDRDDAAATLAFVRQLSRESWRNLNHPPSFYDAMTVDAQADFLGAIVAHPKSFMIAAWLGDRVVGTTNLAVSGATVAAHVGELGLGVLESARGRGVGRLLTETLIAEARRVGVTNLLLRVRTFNEAAIRLYERVGFRRIGILAGVAQLPDGAADEYVYQRT